jgi:hypothetical protein
LAASHVWLDVSAERDAYAVADSRRIGLAVELVIHPGSIA